MFRAAQQFNGRERETATLLSRCVVSLSLCGSGFAPHHRRRSGIHVQIKTLDNWGAKEYPIFSL